MKLKNILFIVIFLPSFGLAQVSRIVLSTVIYDRLYGTNTNPESYGASILPNPYVDLPINMGTPTVKTWYKKALVLNYLDFSDGITPFSFDRSIFFKPLENVTRYEALVAIMEAWDLGIDKSGNVNYNDIDEDNPYFPYINEAEDEGVLTNLFGSNFNGNQLISNAEFFQMLENTVSDPTNIMPISRLNNFDNYLSPLDITPINLSNTKGPEQGIFSHYAKNSFQIPDRLFDLDFSHFYSSQKVELPPGMNPIRPIGRGWSHSYNSYIFMDVINNIEIQNTEIEMYNIVWPDGSSHLYYRGQSNPSLQDYFTPGVFDEFDFYNNDEKIVITKKDQTKYTYEKLDNDREIWYLTKIEKPNENKIDIGYESAEGQNYERIEYVQAPSGKRLNFEYHIGTDLLSKVIDPIGREIAFDYFDYTFAWIENYPTLSEFRDAKNQKTEYHYLGNEGQAALYLTEIKLPRNNLITALYDNKSKLKEYKINDNLPVQVDVKIDYENAQPIQTKIDMPVSGGTYQRFTFNYDSNNRLENFNDEFNSIALNYPSSGKLVKTPSSYNLNLIQTNLVYDNRGNVTEVVYERNNKTITQSNTYDSDNNLTSYTDPEGNTTYYYYDSNENLIKITDALGNDVIFAYDIYGQIVSQTNQEGITVSKSYEYDGVVSHIFAPAGIEIDFTYDGVNRMTEQNNNGRLKQFSYDANDNLTQIIEANGVTTQFTYDSNDNISNILNAKGVSTSFTYNNEDQPITSTFGSLVTTFNYNTDGDLKRVTKPSGSQLNITYDSDGLQKTIGTVSNIDYNSKGLVTSITNPSGTISFGYDDFYRIDEITTVHGLDVNYDYEKTGNVESINYPLIGGVSLSVEYEYDAKNRIDDIKISSNLWSGQKTLAHYEFKDDDRLQSVDFYNGTSQLYYYDLAGRNIRILTKKSNNTTIFDGIYNYDVHSNITQEQTSYFEMGTPPIVPKIETTNSQNYTYNNTNHILTGNGELFSVSTDGNIVNLGAGVTATFTLEDRLSNYSQSGVNNTFKYDAYGQRVEANRNGIITKYVRDVLRDNILIELDGSNNLKYFYLWHPNGTLMARMKPNGELQFYHGDIRGSTVAISDENENITHQYHYKTFGEIEELIEPENEPNTFRYVGTYGVEFENDNLYYMRARYYQPSTGRFISQDPIWSTNLYPYADNNPINKIDPKGEKSLGTNISDGIQNINSFKNYIEDYKNSKDKKQFFKKLVISKVKDATLGKVIQKLVCGPVSGYIASYTGPAAPYTYGIVNATCNIYLDKFLSKTFEEYKELLKNSLNIIYNVSYGGDYRTYTTKNVK